MTKELTAQANSLAVNLNEKAMEAMRSQRTALKEFIGSQMVEGINNDFAVIPGCKHPSLLKPGAEKIANIFQLGSRIVNVEKDIDMHQSFVMFTYRIEIYYLPNDVAIATCEGSCNNLEAKYRNVPFGSVINTVQKMAQKRAYVGAVISATGASDFFTQDMEDRASDGASKGKTSVPNTGRATKTDASDKAGICECGNKMMISNYDKSQWYCGKCKQTTPVEAA